MIKYTRGQVGITLKSSATCLSPRFSGFLDNKKILHPGGR